MAASKKGNNTGEDKMITITSCTLTWEKRGTADPDEIISVRTRILPMEIQVRYYNAAGLVSGKIWPLPEAQRQELFAHLDMLVHEESDEKMPNDGCGIRWQMKICSKGKCLKLISGAEEAPPSMQMIREMLARLTGGEHGFLV